MKRSVEELLPTTSEDIKICPTCGFPVYPEQIQSVEELLAEVAMQASDLQRNVLRLMDNRRKISDIAHDVLAILEVNLMRGAIVCKDQACNDELRGYIKIYKERLSKLVVKPGRVFLDIEALKRADFS